MLIGDSFKVKMTDTGMYRKVNIGEKYICHAYENKQTTPITVMARPNHCIIHVNTAVYLMIKKTSERDVVDVVNKPM